MFRKNSDIYLEKQKKCILHMNPWIEYELCKHGSIILNIKKYKPVLDNLLYLVLCDTLHGYSNKQQLKINNRLLSHIFGMFI